MSMSSFIDQLASRLDQIRQTLPPTVKLIAVTKQVPIEVMRAAYELGVRDFGESRIQETTDKQAQLDDLPDITWHLIGHLQANKAVKALEQFDWIHSVDSLKLAQRLDQLAAGQMTSPKLCLQVKMRPDPTKYGWTATELLQALPDLDRCCHLKMVGLMCIPPYGLPPQEVQQIFEETRELAQQIQQQHWTNLRITELSMGMSGDYLPAIQAGATLIRVGRTLFGDRV